MNRIIKKAGTIGKLAIAMDVDPPVLNNWRNRGIPASKVLALSKAIDYQLTPHQIDKAVYPYRGDALPKHVFDEKFGELYGK